MLPQVTKRGSNINYYVLVRSIRANGKKSAYQQVKARTAPNGCKILQFITTPTFISLCLEQIPGSTGWEIEYTNTRTGESFVKKVPRNVSSRTFYVAIYDCCMDSKIVKNNE
ncbi:unnamed protein product [Clavelina lepadiformis]|uniref:Uncharacterized protein n=1 Tax=Clavelina lepadiformis TaxID=159417 RepID=A0ABP0GLU4_CLALP